MKNIFKLGTFLLIVSAIAAGALAATYTVTAPKIEAQKQATIQRALASNCLPGCTSIKTKEINGNTYYIGYTMGDHLSGYAFRVLPKGYGGSIDMLVGMNTAGKVTGIKILSMSETPGLGTQANTPAFLGQFLGKTINSKLKAKQDIDAISGATISTQAVANGVREALVLFGKL